LESLLAREKDIAFAESCLKERISQINERLDIHVNFFKLFLSEVKCASLEQSLKADRSELLKLQRCIELNQEILIEQETRINSRQFKVDRERQDLDKQKKDLQKVRV
jgi:hypothetical protein